MFPYGYGNRKNSLCVLLLKTHANQLQLLLYSVQITVGMSVFAGHVEMLFLSRLVVAN